jgi:hypothetical protein
VLLGEDPSHRSRDTYVADVIRREVLAKHRRALILYGNRHMIRQHAVTERRGSGTFVDMLESAGDAKVFSIWSDLGTTWRELQHDVASWPIPSLATIRGTVLGRADFGFYSSFGA